MHLSQDIRYPGQLLARRHWTGHPQPRISLEVFAPKSDKAAESLDQTIDRLRWLNPAFISVTYGAGGSTRASSLATTRRLAETTGLPIAGHLTCVAAPKSEVNAVAEAYWDAGIRHIVALRGDPPGQPGGQFRPHPDGYSSSVELIRALSDIADFEISVAAYPEVHPDAASAQADLDFLKRKIDAGATRAITQFFFDPAVFLRFRDRAAAAGITIPILPGILTIANVARAFRFAASCGTSVPAWLHQHMEGLDDDPDTRHAVATVIAEEMCRELMVHGVDHLHFYTLNKADLMIGVCHLLGIRPAARVGGALPAPAHERSTDDPNVSIRNERTAAHGTRMFPWLSAHRP